MAATIRVAQPFSVPMPSVSGVVTTKMAATTRVTPRAISQDRSTVYGTRDAKVIVQSVDDGVTWTTVYTHPDFDGMRGFWLTPDGEAMYSTESAGVGQSALYKSTGWATDPAAATWRKVLNTSAKGNLRVHDAWGLSWAPKGHVREGLMVATEYGGQGSGSDVPSEIGKVWRSWDHGATWHVIFILGEDVQVQQQHMHAVAYDPYYDTIILTYGDANSGAGSKSRIVYTEDVTAERAAMEWKTIFDSGTAAQYQAVTIQPTATCLVLGGDGYPCGVYRVPRREGRTYGAVEQAITFRGGTDTGWISQLFYQHPDGGPVFLAKQYTKDFDEPASLDVFDGVGKFAEIWRDDANRAGVRRPSMSAVGVTANGWIVGTYSHNVTATDTGEYFHFRARYVP